MKFAKNRIAAIAIVTLFAFSTFAILPLTNAQHYSVTVPTWAYLVVNPNPVGRGQTVFIAMWIDKVPPTAMGIVGDRWVGFTVKVTLPDKTTTTLGPYTSDDAGGYATTYVPTELGNYTMVFSFPGETLTGNQGNPSVPASENNDPSAVGDVYGPSTSAPASFTVGTTPASTIPQNPLPTGYWQTPVEAFNNNWYVIDGNWLGICPASFSNTGDYAFTGNFNPYSTAVLSPHIVWTRSEIPGAAGGQMGGEFGSSEQANYFYGCAYQPKFAPIVMNGVVYYDAYPGESTGDGGHDGWVAVNLRTGQTIWTQNYLNYFAPGSDDFLMCGQIYVYKNMNYYGGDTYLWAFRTTNGVNYYDLFDAASGKYILSISGAGMGGIMFNPTIEGSDGSLLQYYINFTFNPDGSESQSLTFWNSSTCLNPTQSQFWGPGQNTVIPYSQGIVWSVPLPNSLNGVPFGPGVGFSMTNVGTAAYDPVNNIMVIQASAGPAGWYPGWVIEAGYNLNTGAQLWIKNETVPPFSSVLIIPGAESGVYAEFDKEALTWSGYSTLTGQKVWGPTEPYANPLGYYDGCSALCAYGNLYTWTFGGWVYCYNMTNGNLVWSWNDGSAGENTPYGVNTLWISTDSFASIADGVIYVESGHNYGPPLYNGAQLYALNTTNGKEIWSILNFDTGSCPCIVDGYLLVFNAYDNQIYCYGKGLTATTVTTSPTIGSSTQVLISGTVTDQSPGQTCLGIPAAGTPAIADQYMNQWMEYLYEQSPEPTNATGVPVTLTEIDPNNNTYTIGVTTSNIAGHYNYVFTPNVPGIYTIIATFGGSNSYFSSTAQTSFNFVPPAPATPTPTPTPASLVNTYFVPAVIAIIIVILIVGAVLFLALRKRP